MSVFDNRILAGASLSHIPEHPRRGVARVKAGGQPNCIYRYLSHPAVRDVFGLIQPAHARSRSWPTTSATRSDRPLVGERDGFPHPLPATGRP